MVSKSTNDENVNVAQYEMPVFGDYSYEISSLIGKVNFAVNENSYAKLAYEMIKSGFVHGFDIVTEKNPETNELEIVGLVMMRNIRTDGNNGPCPCQICSGYCGCNIEGHHEYGKQTLPKPE